MQIDTIQQGNAFELISEIQDHSIDLLLTDPPYFLNGSKGYKNAKWDSISFIIPSTYGLTEASFDRMPPAERSKVIEQTLNDYFAKVITTFTPKLKRSGALVIFNSMENIQRMKNVLEKDIVGKDEYLAVRGDLNGYLDNYHRWLVDNDIEWAKQAPSPLVNEINKAEYALVAFSSMGFQAKATAHSLYSSDNSTSINTQFWAHSPKNTSGGIYGKNTGHLTPKPFDMWRNLILKFSKPGDILLDPFSGSGTTALVAADLGRHFYAIEQDAEQSVASQQRLQSFTETTPLSLFRQEL